MLCIVLIILLIIILFRWMTDTRSDSISCLVGKTAIVTGGNDGIGYAIVLLLASRGCKVIIADISNAEKSKNMIKKLTNNNNISAKYLDLSSFASVRKFAEEIKTSETKIDILINNAGINANSAYETKDGLSSTMQVNYFGAFLLTHLLVDVLKKAEGARIVFVGSLFAFINNLSVENLSGFDHFKRIVSVSVRYGNSKFCNILAAQEFGTRLKKFNITAYSADPGTIRTKIFDVKDLCIWLTGVKNFLLWIIGNKPIVGAQTAFHVATSGELEGKTGGYFFQCRPWIKPWKLSNPEFCRNIWEKSEELVKLRSNEKL